MTLVYWTRTACRLALVGADNFELGETAGLDAQNAGRLASARRPWITPSKGAIIWFERFLALAISDRFLIGA